MAKNISIVLSLKDKVTQKAKAIGREVKKASIPLRDSKKSTEEIRREAERLRTCFKANTKEGKQLKTETKEIKRSVSANVKKQKELSKEALKLNKAYEKSRKSTRATKEETQKIKKALDDNKKKMREVGKEAKAIQKSLGENTKKIKQNTAEGGKLKRELGKIKGLKALDKDAKKAVYSLKKLGTQGVRSVNSVINKAAKLGATLAGALATAATAAGAFAIKTGLSEAMDLEGYKLQLETATKSTKKASKIMAFAINLANKTPFEGGQLVEGAAKFEAMGMSAKKWLTLTGDMAAATNKDFDQATEALIDAQNGELERLKEFGIKKTQIADKANEMFKGHEVINQKGQIVDQEKFNEALVAIMKERYSGGMEKQAKSLKGIMSTISGVMKSGLASIMGMQSDGKIKEGSIFDILKQKAEMLAQKFQKWQNDGTFDKVGQKISQAVSLASQKIGQFISIIKKNKGTIIDITKRVVAFAVAFKAVTVIIKIITILKKVWSVLSAVKTIIMAVGLGWVAVVAAIVVAVALLIKNWDKVKAAAGKLWESIKKVGENIKEVFKNAFDFLSNKAKESIEAVTGFFKPLMDKINGFKDAIGNGFNTVKEKVSGALGIKGHATGTTYASGGPRVVNERGSGEIIDLPNGSRVIPADQTRRMGQGSRIEVNVTVQGNVIGNEQYADELGNTICKKIVECTDNM